MHLRTLVRVAAACLALAACESSTGSVPLQGTYTLRTVDGHPVPATLDSVVWTDGVSYTVDRLESSSVEILDADSARYTLSEQTMSRLPSGDFAVEGSCISVVMQYRVRDGHLLLIVDPWQFGHTGRLRLESLQIGDETLVLDTRNGSGRAVRLEYAAATQPARCVGFNP